MEIFKITCVTCNAKLSVRNREVIGQIVACPRCNSMVQVEVPASAAGAVATDHAENVTEHAENVTEPQIEPEQVPVDEVSLHTSVSIMKTRLMTWTLASFVVVTSLGGAVLFWRSDSAEGDVTDSPEVSQSERVAVGVPAEVIAKPPLKTADPSEPQVSEEPATSVKEIKTVEAVEVVESEQAVAEETVVAKPQAAARFDALDLDPESLDLETLNSAAGKEPVATASEIVVPQENPEPAQSSTLPVVRRDPEQERSETIPLAEKQLEQRFPALTVTAMPISDFLSLIARLGGVPVSIAPQQLQMAGITSRQSVSLDAKDISLAEALRRVLDPLHLEATTEGPQVVVVRQKAATVRTIEYPLDDLLNSTTSLEDIVGWVEQFVVPESDYAEALKTSADSLRVEQTQQIQYQVLIFLERLRLARKLQPQSRFPVERLAGAAAHATLAERLGAPTTFTFSHYTPMSEVVRYWQQELDIPILIDWPVLAINGFWPDSRIACAIENEPWQEALDHVLEPLGLGWRAVAGGAIEITSAEKVQTELQLELVQLGRELGNDAERVLEELRSIAGKPSEDIVYDPTGKVLIVRQPAAAQRLIYQWLVDEKLVQGD